jgi:hypothetical protein
MTRSLLAVLLLLAAAPAVADEVAEARAQFDAGAKLFHAGKYREAITRFEAAYRLKPHGAIHFNVAQCREKLGEWPAALRSYQDYLRELPEARDRAAVRADIGRIEQRLAGAGVQALLVYSDPPGAALRLDGKARGRTPFLITLPPGAYRITLSLDGFATEEQEVEVNLAASRLVEAVLRPQAVRPGVARSQPAATLAAPGAASAGAATATAPPDPSDPANRAHASALSSGVPLAAATAPSPAGPPDLSPSAPAASPLGPPVPPEPAPYRGEWTTRRIAAWATAVAAVIAVGAGVSSGVQAQHASSQLKDGTVRSSAEADALARDAKAKARTANTLYVVGGVAAAASGTLFVIEGRF